MSSVSANTQQLSLIEIEKNNLRNLNCNAKTYSFNVNLPLFETSAIVSIDKKIR